MDAKIKATKFEVTFTEAGDAFKATCESWVAITGRLWRIRRLAMEKDLRGYYKTDFRVTFEDGAVYQGRMDVGQSDEVNLSRYIRTHCEDMTGRSVPAHLTAERWNAYLAEFVTPADKATMEGFLDRYDLGGF